jgi:hypothetical protein
MGHCIGAAVGDRACASAWHAISPPPITPWAKATTRGSRRQNSSRSSAPPAAFAGTAPRPTALKADFVQDSRYGHGTWADLLEVIVDGGESAKNLNRPGLQRLIAMVEAGKVKAVIVAKLDRLTRSVKHLCGRLSYLKSARWR